MKRENFILPQALSERRPTGVLDTPEKVRQAAERMRQATCEAFEEIRISRQKSLEEATRRFLD